MFIHVDDVTCAVHLRRDAVSSFKNMQRKPGLECFVHPRVWRHVRQMQNFVTS